MRLKFPTWIADRMLHLLLALALVRGLVYVAVVPPWQHYDEPGHFEYAKYMARHHRLPTLKTTDLSLRRKIVDSMERHSFGNYQSAWKPPSTPGQLKIPKVIPIPQFRHPPLYYLLGAALLSAFPSQTIEADLYALRLMSVVLNLLLLVLAAAMVSYLLPGRKEILYGVLLFVIFLPAYSDVTTAVNNDVLANLLFTGLVYLLIIQIIRGPSWQLGLATACILILGLATKRTTLVGLFLVLAVVIIFVRQRWGRQFQNALIILASLILVGIVVILAWQTNRGLGLLSRVDSYLLRGQFTSFLNSLLDWGHSWPIYQRTASLLFRGFWGHFGWGTEAFSDPLYYFLLIATVTALVGVMRTLIRGPKTLGLDNRQKQALWILVVALALVWLAALMRVHPIQATGSTYLPTARYTYVAIVPAAVLFVIGLRAWVPSRWRGWLVVGLAVGGILMDTLFLTKYLLPFYLG